MRIKAGGNNPPTVKAVRIDGRDVTADCCEFDSRAGWADVFERDAAGNFLMVTRGGKPEVSRVRLFGHVTYDPYPDPPADGESRPPRPGDVTVRLHGTPIEGGPYEEALRVMAESGASSVSRVGGRWVPDGPGRRGGEA